jgi:hypothetical protein
LKSKIRKTTYVLEGRVVWSGTKDASGSYKLSVEFKAPPSGFWGDDYNPEDPSSIFD